MLLAPCVCGARDLRIGVFGLFHPGRLVISSLPAQSVMVTAGSRQFILPEGQSAYLDLEASRVRIRMKDESLLVSAVTITDQWGRSTKFQLSIPGEITRRFRGRLVVECEAGELVPVVKMDLETAVASAVAAESAPGAPLEALKAQAIATRSYYLASPRRHRHFDFCDTTHCQFLREAPDSLAAQATEATRGIVLWYDGAIIPALFTGSCGGRTRTLAEVGLQPGTYPYYSVSCPFCQHHATHWLVRLDPAEAAGLANHTEGDRLRVGRILGWDAVPGNNYELRSDGDAVLVEGSGKGHGVGLCQLGAAAMARQGSGFQAILAHYFPNTFRSAQNN
jgi:peptidoglycan hydrolase-like amidase